MMGRNHMIAGLATTSISLAMATSIGIHHTPHTTYADNWLLTVSKWLFTYPHVSATETLFIAPILLILGSLLPDIDQPNSKLGRYIYLPLEHRTWTHTLYPLILLGLTSIWFKPLIWLTFGYFTHLLWDSLSVSGIAWLNPITGYIPLPNGGKIKKHHYIKLYHVGSSTEWIITITLAITGSFAIYYLATTWVQSGIWTYLTH